MNSDNRDIEALVKSYLPKGLTVAAPAAELGDAERQARFHDWYKRYQTMAKIPRAEKFQKIRIANYPVLPHNIEAINQVKLYLQAAEFNLKRGIGMWMVGGVGSGKTLLNVAAMNSLPYYLKRKTSAYFLDWRSFIAQSIVTPAKDRGPLKDIIDQAQRVEVLVLDEVGAEEETKYTAPIINELVGSAAKDGRSVWITTNLKAKNLKEVIGERTVDRLYELVPKEYQIALNSPVSLREEPQGELKL